MNTENNRMIELELHRLDMVASKAEAIYGIGNLLEWMPEDFKMKWQSQRQKLDDAVSDNDAPRVSLIVDGTIRGWQMMQDYADQNGKIKNTPEFMEIKTETGFHLRIAYNNSDARRITDKGVHVWSLEEVARVIESEYTLVNKVKDFFPDAAISKISEKPSFDFEKGDDLPESFK